jgi:hypothetical protein
MAIDRELLRKCVVKVAVESNNDDMREAYENATEFHNCPVFVQICAFIANLVEKETGLQGIIAACGTSFQTGFHAGREYERELAATDRGAWKN